MALPPPSTMACFARAPISAILPSDGGCTGSVPSRFAASTNDLTASSLASAGPSTGAGRRSGGTISAAPASAPILAASRSTRLTCSSITSGRTAPSRTAATSRLPHRLALAGMTTSNPPFAVPAVSCAAIQSETTTPSKPHSSLSTPSWRVPLVDIAR